MNNRILLANNLDEFSFINHKKGEISVLNLEQEYQHITCLQNKVLGYEHSSLIGKTNFNIQAPAVELAPQFHQECQRVIDSQMSMVFLCSGAFAKNEAINYLYTIAPIQRKDGMPLGLIIYGERLKNHSSAMQAVNALYKNMDSSHNYKTCLLAPSYPGLTKRESQCLYWLLRGYNTPQIAEQLFLSKRTIESHFESIKLKYNCQSKKELVDFCYELNLFQVLPLG